jgi:hypothetical protein
VGLRYRWGAGGTDPIKPGAKLRQKILLADEPFVVDGMAVSGMALGKVAQGPADLALQLPCRFRERAGKDALVLVEPTKS